MYEETWATHNTFMWLNSDQGLLVYAQSLAYEGPQTFADEIQRTAQDTPGLFTDMDAEDWEDVDWQAVIDDILA